jgi:DNA-directed RNA polymerase subunit RPC12/RpoP
MNDGRQHTCTEEATEYDSTAGVAPGGGAVESRADEAVQDTAPAVPAETFGVICPLCGGSLRIREGERSIACEYCGSGLIVTRPHGVRSFTMQPRITPGKARLTALKHLSGQTGGRVRARHASIVDIKLIQVPFWRMHGKLMGWVCGDTITLHEVETASPDPRSERTIKTIKEERQPFSKLVLKHVEWSTPASILKNLGLQGISLKTRTCHWDVFDHELKNDHVFALPMKTAQEARGDAYKYLTRVTAPARSQVRASRFHLADSNFSLYYYPMYFIRYRHGGRIYTITTDGSDGRVVCGETPQRKGIDFKTMFFVPAAFAFLAQTYLPLALIAAFAIYVTDAVQTEGFLPPHRWLAARLDRWFGGDW